MRLELNVGQLLGLNNNDDLFNPKKNFEAAKFIFDQQCLRAWGAYRNGSYRDYLSLLMACCFQTSVIWRVSGGTLQVAYTGL